MVLQDHRLTNRNLEHVIDISLDSVSHILSDFLGLQNATHTIVAAFVNNGTKTHATFFATFGAF